MRRTHLFSLNLYLNIFSDEKAKVKKSGSHLLSHIVSNAVPSAVTVLTVVFGMGTGVSPQRIATGNVRYHAGQADDLITEQ